MKEKKKILFNKIDINRISSFNNEEEIKMILKKEYNNSSLLKEKKNYSLSFIIIGIILLIIGIIFIPMAIINTIRESYFSYLSLEAFIAYLGIGIGSILFILGIIYLIIYIINYKINKENISLLINKLNNK